VGAGIWPNTSSIAERVPVGERVEPGRDERWRRDQRARWRDFVERAAEL
jgi:glycerol kinase